MRKKNLCLGFLVGFFVIASLAAQQPTAPVDKDALPTFVVLDVAKKFRIIAYGDVRYTDPEDRERTNPVASHAIVQKIVEEKPSAVLIGGDLPYRGGHDSDWQQVDAGIKPLWDAKIRIYPALGNHEFYGSDERGLANWWKRFPDLDGKRWYSVLFGNCFFITLDSNSSLSPGQKQEVWLTKQLAHLPAQADFIFFDLHHPPYTDSNDHLIPGVGHSARQQEKNLAAQLEALQPKTRARFIVIAGHVHNYERFENAGVTYIVSGGGGATPYVFDRSPRDKYQGGKTVTFHYVRFDIDGPTLTGKMFKLDLGNEQKPKFDEKDSFELKAVPLAGP